MPHTFTCHVNHTTKLTATTHSVKGRAWINGRWISAIEKHITFEGGKDGAHTIDARVHERVLEHWRGYCENNGVKLPRVGDRVGFIRGMFGAWQGTVTHVSRGARVTVRGVRRNGCEFDYVVPAWQLL